MATHSQSKREFPAQEASSAGMFGVSNRRACNRKPLTRQFCCSSILLLRSPRSKKVRGGSSWCEGERASSAWLKSLSGVTEEKWRLDVVLRGTQDKARQNSGCQMSHRRDLA
jgi:hypothetical protein